MDCQFSDDNPAILSGDPDPHRLRLGLESARFRLGLESLSHQLGLEPPSHSLGLMELLVGVPSLFVMGGCTGPVAPFRRTPFVIWLSLGEGPFVMAKKK